MVLYKRGSSIETRGIVTGGKPLAQVIEQHHAVPRHARADDVGEQARVVGVAERAIGEQRTAGAQQHAPFAHALLEQRAFSVGSARQREHEVVVRHSQRPVFGRVVGLELEGLHVPRAVHAGRSRSAGSCPGSRVVCRAPGRTRRRIPRLRLRLRRLLRRLAPGVARIRFAHALRQRSVVEPGLASLWESRTRLRSAIRFRPPPPPNAARPNRADRAARH